MKVIYALRATSHFLYHSSVISCLSIKGHNIHILFDRKDPKDLSSRAYQGVQDFRAKTKGITIDWFTPRSDIWRWPLFSSRELLSYISYLNREDQSEYYLKRWRGYLTLPLQELARFGLVNKFLRWKIIESKLKELENQFPPDRKIIQYLKDYQPDVVVASPGNMRYSEEIEYIKAAKALGIPTIISVLSWDNLTTKGLIHVIPDLVLAWNKFHLDELISIHGIPEEKIIITGAPVFDKWVDKQRSILSREEFCKKIGLDSARPFIIYLGSSAHIAENETWLILELLDRLKNHSNPNIKNMNIMVRPHPANTKIYEKLDDYENIHVWPKEGALPDTEESLTDFYNSLQHSVATVGINTSGMIDSLMADKPCITIITEKYQSTQMDTVHFRNLFQYNVLEIARNTKECVDIINRLYQGVDTKREERQHFIQDFTRPRGLNKKASAIAALAIELTALGKTPGQIDLKIEQEIF